MAAIDIGPGAVNRGSTFTDGYTVLCLDNPANGSGTLVTMELWFGANAQTVKCGTFYGSGTSYTDRDHEVIGNVTSGSKQTFSGLNCTVVSGDYLGVYYSSGAIERDGTGFAGTYYDSGDQFKGAASTFILASGEAISIYAESAAGTDHTKNLSDTLSISDSLKKDIGLFKSEAALGLSDSIVKGIGLNKSDGPLGIADSIVKDVGLNKSDTVAIGDSFARQVAFERAFSETLPIRETEDGWYKRIKITLDHTKVTSLLTDFPAMVYLSASSGQNNDDVSCVFDELQSDANRKKIRITTEDGTECYVEIDQWDDANEKAWLHVKVPAIASSEDTILYLYYNSLHADNTTYVGDTNSVAAENVWDAYFKAVYHMSDGVDNAHIYDSTSNNNDGTKKAANEPLEVAGTVGRAQDFDGADDYIDCGSGASLDNIAVKTVECLVKIPDPGNANPTIVAKVDDPDNDLGWYIFMGGWNNRLAYAHYWSGARGRWYAPTNSFTFDAWHLDTVVYDRGSTANDPLMYINGVSQAVGELTAPSGTVTDDSAVPCYIGASYFAGHNPWNFMDGSVGELRISSTNREGSWISTTYYTLWDDFCTFGAEAPLGVVKAIGKFLSEAAMGITDAISKEPGLVKADSVSITDAGIVKDIGLNKAEAFSLTDAGTVKDIGVFKAETLAIADAIVKAISIPKADTMTITDSIVKAIGVIQTETFALADSIVKDIGVNKADTLTITDAVAKDISVALADAIAILDSLVITGSYDRPGIKVAAFLFKRAINAMLHKRDINLKSRREF